MKFSCKTTTPFYIISFKKEKQKIKFFLKFDQTMKLQTWKKTEN
ncbi:hypothetical protein TOT_020000502 [Theileria orientalis strain Shintoku]|uniref:Uncharacterized protein n=1 Tax=Theileria orientalis strain Shintoku TaxID=869250 RepID=J4C3D3_THEOR|nr:hypothetical protein TOT_020000502 [Theileria orientalis strain Shintoku]BAM40241.1 hypothetical protein TOT_020000502 [Theileria orientalis strain Shintoku]|eukprot:XP_009690542.1 hypothetical protein TOT_020000502 [Theileria orientalis strain Shintoku]